MPTKTTSNRWTDDQVKQLVAAVKNAPTAKTAFEQVAKEIGKSTGTVQQKYYALKRADKPKPKGVKPAAGIAKRNGHPISRAAQKPARFVEYDLAVDFGADKAPIKLQSSDLTSLVQLFELIGDEEGSLLGGLKDAFDVLEAAIAPGMTISMQAKFGNVSVSVSSRARVDY